MADQETQEKDVPIPTRDELLSTTQEPEGELTPETETPSQDPIEQEASNLGWTPKEDWVAAGKDPRHWRPADVWLDRGQFFSTINSLRNELQTTKQQVSEAYNLGRKMAEQTFKEELDSLKTERKQALEVGDLVRADELQDEINQHKEKAKDIPKLPTKDFAPPPEYHLFVERNPWYSSDTIMRHAADGLGVEFLKANPKTTPADLYYFVETKMRERFGDVVESTSGTRRARVAPQTETAGNNTRGTPTSSSKDSVSSIRSGLSQAELSIIRNVAKTAGMTEEEYLKSFAKQRTK